MNLMNLMLLLHICIMCLWLACDAKPTKALKSRNSKGTKKSLRQRATKRQRSNRRRLRMLQKMLKRLTPDDVMQLARSKKDDPYSYGQYHNTHASSIKVKNVPAKEAEKQKECPVAEDGIQLFSCPSPDGRGHYRCIDDHALCDNKYHCPKGEDEDKTVCMFHRMNLHYIKSMLNIILRMTENSKIPS